MSIHAVFCAQDRPGNYAGGPNVWLSRLIPDLRKDGISVTTLVIGTGPQEECPLVSELKAGEFAVRFLDLKGDRPIYLQQKIRWLVQQLNDLKPDVFIPNLMIPAYYTAGLAQKAGIPSIGVVHSNDEFHHRLLEVFVYGLAQRRISSVVAVSHYLENVISEKNVHNVLLDRIPYGVPVPSSISRSESVILRVAYVGRFRQEQKRILDVADSFCLASEVLPNARFTLLGNGPEKAKMAKIIDEYNAESSVYIKDPLPPSEILDFLQSQDVFVLLSDYEGLPIALQEAMAAGMVPVCLSEESGINELIQHGKNGLIVHDRNTEFIDALQLLEENRSMLKKISLHAIESIASHYSAEDQHKKWSSLIERVANQGKKRKIRLPILIGLPPTHQSFRGEDRLAPSFRIRFRHNLDNWFMKLRLAIRPRARLRSMWWVIRGRE